MPKRLAGNSTSHSAHIELPRDTIVERVGHGLTLPTDEYAVLVRSEGSRSAIVAYDSGNLTTSGKLPLEVFPRKDILAGGIAIEATQDEIAHAGLAEIFTSGDYESIHSVLLDNIVSVAGLLLLKTTPDHTSEELRSVCERNAEILESILDDAHRVLRNYQWEILTSTFRCPVPCVVTDTGGKAVFANAMFSELVGIRYDGVIGSQLTDFIHVDKDFGPGIPCLPEYEEVTTPLFIKTQSLFFVSDVRLSRIETACGDRFMYSFCDLSTDRRSGNSNVQLIQKLSAMILSDEQPQILLRRLVNALALTLHCDLVCIMKRKNNNEIIATPYSNRRLETLRINFIQPAKEPILEPYMSHGTPILCYDVEKSCDGESFFRRVLPISRFAFVPAGGEDHGNYVMLMAWSRANTSIDTEALPVLRVIANLLGSVLASARLCRQIEQGTEMLRRYTSLTAGREAKMASLKKENAHLKELIMRLNDTGKE